MAHPSHLKSPVLRLLSFLMVLGCVLASPVQLWAKGCAESLGPAQPPPQSLWGDMEPSAILFDATGWTGSQLPNNSFPVSTSVEIENGWVFNSYYGGFSIWDARTNPGAPARVTMVGGFGTSSIPSWPGLTEFTQIVFSVDVPEGNDGLMAMGAISPVGLTIWDTSNKNAPRWKYQDTGKWLNQVYAARIGTRDYAFAGDFSGGLGLHVYDMTAAKNLTTPCSENRTRGDNRCAGVYLGRIGNAEPAKYVDGLGVGSRYFVVKSGGYPSASGIQIWEVTNPQQPQLVVQDYQGNGSSHGVAMWTHNGQHYLAARHNGDGKIFNITTCLTSGCSNLQNLQIWSQALRPYPDSLNWLGTTFSRSGSTPFVYFGNHDTCHSGEPVGHSDYLFNVSNPAAPVDIVSPTRTIVDDGVTVDYWSWYYSDFIRGWSQFGPRMAKFNGAYLYRAASTLFDVHEWTGAVAGPPVANFTYSPATVYAGDPVDFTSTSTGNPTGFTWTFQDGNPSSATGSGSARTAFTSPGLNKAVSLTATNPQGSNTVTKNVTVLDPAPRVESIQVIPGPGNPLVCQPVTLTAQGVTGKEPLSIQWTVNQTVLGVSNPVTWNTTGLLSGSYPVTVKVSKAGYPDAMVSTTVTLDPLPALPAAGSFTPARDPFTAGTVQFHANVVGATEWRWDFGDNTGQNWTSDPVLGPNPVHTYTSIGQKKVKLWVKNCAQGGTEGIASAELTVDITIVDPLMITGFQAQGCDALGNCDFRPGQAVTFQAAVTGTPTLYEYDWDGNGTFEETSATQVTTHTYSTVGLYFPKLRVRRGAEISAIFTHPKSINIQNSTTNPPPPPPTPSVSINGPNTGLVNQPLSFTATGSNCTPAATWTWNAGTGGSVSGNGANVSITWASAGPKTVQASSGNCSTGSKSLTITETNTGGLTASFTSSPANPQINQAVTFTSTSTGSPTVYLWEFGDGATASTPTASHTYAAAGSYPVKLSIAKDCVSGVCSSQTSTTTTVVVSAGPQLTASFGSPSCTIDLTGERCETMVGQAVTLTSTSVGATSFSWNFSDGTPAGNGAQVSHTWTQPGNYLVQLTVGNGTATATTSRQFRVIPAPVNPDPVSASFTTSATCNAAGSQCEATVGQAVTFNSTSTGATSLSWSFGDNTPAGTGAQVSHTWTTAGNYLVQLTASNGTSSANASRQIMVKDVPVQQPKSVVLPWIAQTRGALVQSSDLYVHNPGKTAMEVTLEFRKRGAPESNPPRVPRTIPAGATLYVGDVLRDLFNRESVAGFIMVTVNQGDMEPVITSFNTTFQADGKQFGQTVSGVSMSSAGSASGSGPENRMQHLVGLIDNTERLAYFGLSNPSDQPAKYRLRFFDKAGKQISESQDLVVSRFGQRQYQVAEIEELFGISNLADYRIEIEKKEGGMIVPYASNLRLSSEDPSFIEAGSSKNAKSYLLGTLSAPGLNNSTWQSDLLLTNISTQPVTAQVTFTSLGLNSVPTRPETITLQPGRTERLENVIASRWNIRNAVGVLTITSTSPDGVFPIVQGESYESSNSDPAKRFGQAMTALSDADAAGPGKSQYLVGMRQDAKNRTTIWIFNPDNVTAEYDIIYRPLAGGNPLNTIRNVRLGAGKMRQFSPNQHPLPPAGVANGFTVEIVVKSGKVLSSAQVINNVTNDPAYIQGEAR